MDTANSIERLVHNYRATGRQSRNILIFSSWETPEMLFDPFFSVRSIDQ
jgi:hypothetical protein